MVELLDEHIAAVRAFTRRWSEVTRVLDSGMYDTPYSLTEGRMIYELAQRDTMNQIDLRGKLGLDPSYLTRLVRRFRSDGMIEMRPSPEDGRKQVLRLTEHGRAVAKLLDERSQEQNRELLAPLAEPERDRLVAAMATINTIIDGTAPGAEYHLRAIEPGDLGWVVARHGAIYAAEREWNAEFEALCATILADYVREFEPGRDNGWIAESAGRPVGSVFCAHDDDQTARLRLLLVEADARGMGIGARLVAECVNFAASAGYQRMELETVSVLTAARRIYEANGFRPYKSEPERRFGHDLVIEQWSREL
ncbi:MAG TPA: helix-turn-helix domain-containing GNAT family N-acetyltransferase [Pseudonocardiaceae bacterium]|nr:helix-turn-helix domain-containing GNAT family N-acetyltransferase [Pseudonocardiaceae bacterium]